jgi:hypothetical protein
LALPANGSRPAATAAVTPAAVARRIFVVDFLPYGLWPWPNCLRVSFGAESGAGWEIRAFVRIEYRV